MSVAFFCHVPADVWGCWVTLLNNGSWEIQRQTSCLLINLVLIRILSACSTLWCESCCTEGFSLRCQAACCAFKHKWDSFIDQNGDSFRLLLTSMEAFSHFSHAFCIFTPMVKFTHITSTSVGESNYSCWQDQLHDWRPTQPQHCIWVEPAVKKKLLRRRRGDWPLPMTWFRWSSSCSLVITTCCTSVSRSGWRQDGSMWTGAIRRGDTKSPSMARLIPELSAPSLGDSSSPLPP